MNHSPFCTYPDGCSCGVASESELADLRSTITSLQSRLEAAEKQSEQYRLETHRWAEASKKDREARDELWKQIRAAESRAQQAEEMRDALTQAAKRLLGALRQPGARTDMPGFNFWPVVTELEALLSTSPPSGRADGERLESEQVGKWAWSTNGEEYDSEAYGSPMEAAWAGFEYMDDDLDEGQSIHVGRIVKPDVPGFIDANRVIEDITERECFDNDWADDWPNASKAQVDELSDKFHAVFVDWMTRHRLEPRWFTIEQDREVTRDEVKAWEASLPVAENEGRVEA